MVKEFIEQDQQNQNNLRQFCTRIKMFESSFFPYCIQEWNNVSEIPRKIESTIQFKMKFLSYIRLKENLIFKIHSIDGIKLVNCLRLRLSDLNEHKFWHIIRVPIDSICSCGLEPETTHYYFLYCNLCSDLRIQLLNDICALNPTSSRKNFECSPARIGGL